MGMAFEFKEEFDRSRKNSAFSDYQYRSVHSLEFERRTADIAEDYRQQRKRLTAMSPGAIAARLRPDYGKRRRRPAARQSRDTDSPARSGAYAASLRDTNSVKSRTRFVLRVSP